MSANQTFNPDNPREALAMLDSLLGLDTMNFNRSMHNGIQRAVATLAGVIDRADGLAGQIETQKELIEMLTRELTAAQSRPLSLVDSPHDTAGGPETGSNAQSAS